jgi:hypothetical protein
MCRRSDSRALARGVEDLGAEAEEDGGAGAAAQHAPHLRNVHPRHVLAIHTANANRCHAGQKDVQQHSSVPGIKNGYTLKVLPD